MEDNVNLNSINNIKIINKDLNLWNTQENFVDYIITNPPYYKNLSNIANKSQEFLISRQEVKLNLKNIFDFSIKALKDRGKLFMIHKPERLDDLIKYTPDNLKIKKIKFVQSKAFEKPVFILLEYVKNAKDGLKFENPLIIYENGKYSEEMKKINGL